MNPNSCRVPLSINGVIARSALCDEAISSNFEEFPINWDCFPTGMLRDRRRNTALAMTSFIETDRHLFPAGIEKWHRHHQDNPGYPDLDQGQASRDNRTSPVSLVNRLAILLVLLISKRAGRLRLPTSRIVMVMAEKTIHRILPQIAQLLFFRGDGLGVMPLSFLVSFGGKRFLDQFGHIRLFVHQDVAGDEAGHSACPSGVRRNTGGSARSQTAAPGWPRSPNPPGG